MAGGQEVAERPAFLITIDTEGDNLWAHPRAIETRNAAYLPRFQRLCERYGLKPVYLTNWEMAENPAYREFALDAISRGAAEVGMHLHAWNSPPLAPLTDDDYRYLPYLIEFPAPILREKVHTLTAKLEECFQTKMISHRAGRWSFDAVYARALLDEGYHVDCSVTPHTSWKTALGDPNGAGGSDYSRAPDVAYWLDEHDVTRPGGTALLEVPTTVLENPRTPRLFATYRDKRSPTGLLSRAIRRFYPQWIWLRPTGTNLRHLLDLLHVAVVQRRDYVEFMLHSSELMPGGSPTFPNEKTIEKLYRDLDALFATASAQFDGLTMSQYYERYDRGGHHRG